MAPRLTDPCGTPGQARAPQASQHAAPRPTQAAAGNAHKAANAIELRDVSLYYGSLAALDGVSLAVRTGERVCVLGANGSGKSTLASVVCGLLAPDEGEVTLVGHACFGEQGVDFDAYRAARREVGLVFQNPDDQIVTSIVEEDVAFGPENLQLPPDEIGRRVERELARVALTDYAQSDPSRLSGGQKQRVAIAGALAMEPRVLVLDEPGALLDVRGRRGIMRVMDELHREGTTILHITHFMEEALAADRVVVMDHGRVVLEGTPSEVFAQGERIAALGLEVPFTARLSQALRKRGLGVPWTCDDGELRAALGAYAGGTPEGQAALDPAADAVTRPNNATAKPSAARKPVAVSADHVTYSYHGTDGRVALDDVSFRVGQGSSVAIVGQTGSGKSTLVRLICALEVPDQGCIEVNSISTSDRRNRRLLHGRIGYVMQHPERQLFAETVLDDVAYGPRNLGLSPAEVRERCEHALALVGLDQKADASPFQISGGQQRLCAIAGVLAMNPGTLVLDEPTAGLDPRGRAQLERILDDIHAQGVTTIRVTHSMDDAARCEQVIVLSQSHLLMQGTAHEVFSAGHADELRRAGLGLPDALNWAAMLGLSTAPLTFGQLVDDVCKAAHLQAPHQKEACDGV